MPLSLLKQRILELQELDDLLNWLASQSGEIPVLCSISGAVGSLPAFVLGGISERTQRVVFCLTRDNDEASYLASDLEQVGDKQQPVLLLPPLWA